MMNEEYKDNLVELAVTFINLQSKDFDESCQKLYESIKAGCSTYGEVQDCIYQIGYNRAFKENRSHYITATKLALQMLYDNDVRKEKIQGGSDE